MRIMRMTSMPVLTSHNAWHQVHRLALRHFECCKGSQRVGKPLAPLPATRTTESSSQIATANSSIKECWAMITHKPGQKKRDHRPDYGLRWGLCEISHSSWQSQPRHKIRISHDVPILAPKNSRVSSALPRLRLQFLPDLRRRWHQPRQQRLLVPAQPRQRPGCFGDVPRVQLGNTSVETQGAAMFWDEPLHDGGDGDRNRDRYRMIEGSWEVKLPTIWTDEKQRWEESERREE